MPSTAEIASGEALTSGQQLMQQFQAVWDVEKRIQALPSLSPYSGLEAAIDQNGITADAVEALSNEQLAVIGEKSLLAYFESTNRQEELAEAYKEKNEAILALGKWLYGNAGQRITVNALEAEDKPISLARQDFSYGVYPAKKLANVTGTLSRWQDPYNPSRRLTINRKSIGRLHLPGFYLVSMCDEDRQPRVEVVVE